eukprot:106817_1
MLLFAAILTLTIIKVNGISYGDWKWQDYPPETAGAFYGTAPTCDGECQSPNVYQWLSGLMSGDGNLCGTGRKVYCNTAPNPWASTKWIGTAPFCNAHCSDCGGYCIASDVCGDGECCISGNKVLCGATGPPTHSPTYPTYSPSYYPTNDPTNYPTYPTYVPTESPSSAPTESPTAAPHIQIEIEGMEIGYLIAAVIAVFLLVGIIIIILCISGRGKNESNKKQKSFDNLKKELITAAKQKIEYFLIIKTKVEHELKCNEQNQVAFSISNFVSHISSYFTETASVFVIYNIIITIIYSIWSPCNCNLWLIILSSIIIGVCWIVAIVLYICSHKTCTWKIFKIIPHAVLCLVLLTSQYAAPFSCWIQSNMIYAFNIILLGTIIAYARFDELYKAKFAEEIHDRNTYTKNDVDTNMHQIASMSKNNKEKLERELDKVETQRKGCCQGCCEYIGLLCQIIAIRYSFEISIIIVYSSVVFVFKILYDECLECIYNEGEAVLRGILWLFFFLLALVIQGKVNYDREKCCECSCDNTFWKIIRSVAVIFSLMYISQTRTGQCLFPTWSTIMTVICCGILLFIAALELVMVLIMRCKASASDSNDEEVVLSPLIDL